MKRTFFIHDGRTQYKLWNLTNKGYKEISQLSIPKQDKKSNYSIEVLVLNGTLHVVCTISYGSHYEDALDACGIL